MHRKILPLFFVMIALAAAIVISSRAQSSEEGAGSVYFTENRGQMAQEVRFQSENGSSTLWVLDDSIWFTIPETLPKAETPAGPGAIGANHGSRALNLRLSFPDSSSRLKIVPAEPLSARRNYLTPRGSFNDVPLWGEVRLEELQLGLDLSIRTVDGAAALVLEAGNALHPAVFDVTISGADGLTLRGGEAIVQTALGEYLLPFRTEIPGMLVRIQTDGGDTLVYAPPEPGAVSQIGEPAAGTLVYGTYYGAAGTLEYGSQVVTGDDGSAYFAGGADAAAFIHETGLVTPLHLVKAFIVKLSPDGTSATYITTISGLDPNGEDFATAVALDDSGAAYLTGLTSSFDFPATTGAYDETPNGGNDAWFAKIDPSGAVVFASVLGTTGNEWANAVGLGTGGEIYVTGFTDGSTFPTTGGAYDTTYNGGFDVFVSKFNNAGSSLLAGTFVGGSADEGGNLSLDRSDVFVDASGSVYITGPTKSGNFPTTIPRIGTGGCKDIYLSKLDSSLASLQLSNRIGGSGSSCGSNGDDNAEKLAVDASGNIFITGYTTTENGTFPVSNGAFDTTYNGFYDAFLLKLNPTATALFYGTFLGGSNIDVAKDLVLDPAGNVYLTGYTYSPTYPTSSTAFDSSLTGVVDAFMTKVYPGNNSSCDLRYSTYLGGGSIDLGVGIALRGSNGVYVTGQTYSGDFPTVPGSYDVTYSGDADAFMLKLELIPSLPAPAWTPAPFDIQIPFVSHGVGCQ